MKFIIFFYFLLNEAFTVKLRSPYCKKDLVENFNMNSYNMPRKIDFYVCPAITSSCCSVYDQYHMFHEWKKVNKPRLIKYHDEIRDKINDLKELVMEVKQIDLESLLSSSAIPIKQKAIIKTQWGIFQNQKILDEFKLLLDLEPQIRSFMMKFRSSFACQICDYQNHHFFDLNKETVSIDAGSCEAIAENSINFSYQMNLKIVRPLWYLSKILGRFLLTPKREFKLNNQKSVFRAVLTCAKGFKSDSGDLGRQCKQMCGYFNFNANSPVIEGYRQFFNDYINFLHTFFSDTGIQLKQKERILSSNVFTTEFLQELPDFYKDNTDDPIFNDYFINQMLNGNEGYEKDRHNNYVKFVKNKYYYMDVSKNPTDPNDRGIFKIASQNLVYLENFQTIVGFKGMDLYKNMKYNNMDGSLKDLINHLKFKTKYKIDYEKLDPTLVATLNDFENDEIKSFHQDNYMLFKAFGDDLIRQQLMANKEQLWKKMKYKGYNVKL